MQDLRRNKDSFGVPKECLSDAIITGMVSIRLVASQIPNRTNGFANMCVCVPTGLRNPSHPPSQHRNWDTEGLDLEDNVKGCVEGY